MIRRPGRRTGDGSGGGVDAGAAEGLRAFARHPGDALRLALALGALALSAVPVEEGRVPVLEEHGFRLVNDLPQALYRVIWLPMQFGAVGAVPLVVAVALLARRRWLALELAVAGVAAWWLAKLIKVFFDRRRPGVLLDGVTLRGDVDSGLGYVSGHSAIAAALAAIASPFLPRRLRRLAWGFVVFVGLARMYVGAHFPLDVLGGWALGAAIAALVHLLLGAPTGRPRPAAVRRVLEGMGLSAGDVQPLAVRGTGSAAFVAGGAGAEPLFVKVVTREHRDADLLHRSWRRLASRWFREKPPFASVQTRVDHETALALLALRAGVRTPEVLSARRVDAATGVVVQRYVAGRALAAMAPGTVTDELLHRVWGEAATLHRAGLTHGDLLAENVLVDGPGEPWLVDFLNGEAGAGAARIDHERADLLVSLAGIVGPERAVDSAVAVLGGDALAPVGDVLARAWRAGESSAVRRRRGELLPVLRRAVARGHHAAVPSATGER